MDKAYLLIRDVLIDRAKIATPIRVIGEGGVSFSA